MGSIRSVSKREIKAVMVKDVLQYLKRPAALRESFETLENRLRQLLLKYNREDRMVAASLMENSLAGLEEAAKRFRKAGKAAVDSIKLRGGL